ncbi:MAG: ABC transporter ATP-binding protein [Phycisphaeraceae bacterium]|nr:ABC transporter ATP-binding protein [Phycisphaeraceae bacterium]
MNASIGQSLPQAGSSLGSEHSKDAALCIHDMTVAYHKRPVLWDVDLDVPRGSLVGVLGPNGAGKSTLIKAVIDQVPRASGNVLIFGGPYSERRERIGYVPQRESVDWDFPVTALDVAAMGLYGRIGWFGRVKRRHREQALAAMERMGIADLANRQISQLSGGQQQRTFLARALVQDADLYLMDEPFAGVDAATERTIVEILRELRARGKTVLVVHHDLQTVREYFDRVILLNMRVVAHGRTVDVFNASNLQKTYGGTLTLLADAAEAMHRSGVRR